MRYATPYFQRQNLTLGEISRCYFHPIAGSSSFIPVSNISVYCLLTARIQMLYRTATCDFILHLKFTVLKRWENGRYLRRGSAAFLMDLVCLFGFLSLSHLLGLLYFDVYKVDLRLWPLFIRNLVTNSSWCKLHDRQGLDRNHVKRKVVSGRARDCWNLFLIR